jgi:hypothetical protein
MQQATWSVDRTPSDGFKYFWMKNVTGFDDKVHCARCLVGKYDKGFKVNALGGDISAKVGDIIYLCGVSAPYRWANNFHRAAVVTLDAADIIDDTLFGDMGTIRINGAKVIDFDGKSAANNYPNLGRAFLTCRNFQFAAQQFG